jgi:hypothetical protein
MDLLGASGARLRPILARALNRNQLLILSCAAGNKGQTITTLLSSMSLAHRIPLSTLKLNAKILRELGLLSFGDSNPAVPTLLGRCVRGLLEIETENYDIPVRS